MKTLKRLSAIAAASAMLMSFTSCGDSKNSSESSAQSGGNALVEDNIGDGINVSADEMPFGATMIDIYPDDVPIAVSYEKRFMTEDEAVKISDYISAVNSIDAELMEKTGYMPYLEYIISNYGNTDLADYLSSRHKEIKSDYIGENFDFDYIITNALYDENDDDSTTGFSALDSKLRELSPDIDITSRKMVEVEILYTPESGGNYSLSRRTGSDTVLYLYTIDGQIYVL